MKKVSQTKTKDNSGHMGQYYCPMWQGSNYAFILYLFLCKDCLDRKKKIELDRLFFHRCDNFLCNHFAPPV